MTVGPNITIDDLEVLGVDVVAEVLAAPLPLDPADRTTVHARFAAQLAGADGDHWHLYDGRCAFCRMDLDAGVRAVVARVLHVTTGRLAAVLAVRAADLVGSDA